MNPPPGGCEATVAGARRSQRTIRVLMRVASEDHDMICGVRSHGRTLLTKRLWRRRSGGQGVRGVRGRERMMMQRGARWQALVRNKRRSSRSWLVGRVGMTVAKRV